MKSARERILEAALTVFGRKGISGATTREIARVARVNEVTLFRAFRSKAELLRAVVTCTRLPYGDVLEDAPCATRADLHRIVTAYAEGYVRAIQAKEDFVRTLLGELHRHPRLGQQLLAHSSKPVRVKFIAYLRTAQRAGLVRRRIDLSATADALTGMLLAGVMRRPIMRPDYEPEIYFRACVELFLRGLAL